jgi:hypothetical protein
MLFQDNVLDNNGLGVAPRTAEVLTSITSSTLASMKQMRYSAENAYDDINVIF